MRKFLVAVGATALLGLLAGCEGTEQPMVGADEASTADTVFLNGKFYTVNEAQPWAEAVAVKGRKLLAVGTTAAISALG